MNMRKYNPKRFTRHNDRCNCEHTNHFTEKGMIADDGRVIQEASTRTKHPYLRRPAGNAWAMYVGHVCDDCAATCLKDYIIASHVCGTGDCHRECPEMAEFGTCIHSEHMQAKGM